LVPPILDQETIIMTYTTTYYNARWWVEYQGRLIGAYSTNPLRSYIFPLYTPQGMLVLQESPPDHPHHQGMSIGLEVDGHDLWNAGSYGKPPHRQEAIPAPSEFIPISEDQGVLFKHQVRWVTTEGVELLREYRQIIVSAHTHFNLIEWHSTFSHPTKSTTLAQTKEAGIGVRIPPQWETRFGGEIRNANGAVGEAATFDQESAWLNVQGPAVGGEKAGLIFWPLPSSEACPWFTRDYGPQLYNPLRHHAINLEPGRSFTWAVCLLAYDGDRSLDQLNQLVGAVG
jgi:hypothetical protein